MWRAVWASLKKWFVGWLNGGPHFVVGGLDRPYMRRWHILPRNPFFNVYLHCFHRDDDDRARHDHPWVNMSILLSGRYREVTATGRKEYRAGHVICRRADYAHRVELINGQRCWTLFVTGPKVRNWGFHCPLGWIPWQDFVDQHDSGNIGKGCPE